MGTLELMMNLATAVGLDETRFKPFAKDWVGAKKWHRYIYNVVKMTDCRVLPLQVVYQFIEHCLQQQDEEEGELKVGYYYDDDDFDDDGGKNKRTSISKYYPRAWDQKINLSCAKKNDYSSFFKYKMLLDKAGFSKAMASNIAQWLVYRCPGPSKKTLAGWVNKHIEHAAVLSFSKLSLKSIPPYTLLLDPETEMRRQNPDVEIETWYYGSLAADVWHILQLGWNDARKFCDQEIFISRRMEQAITFASRESLIATHETIAVFELAVPDQSLFPRNPKQDYIEKDKSSLLVINEQCTHFIMNKCIRRVWIDNSMWIDKQ